jgi:RNA polymerase sigma factor (sigma-70 family)
MNSQSVGYESRLRTLPPQHFGPQQAFADNCRSSSKQSRTQENFLHRRKRPIIEAFAETTPFDALTLAETQTALMAIIRTLQREQRLVLLLYFYRGLKLTEIAAKLHLPPSKVSARLCRACRELRRLLFGNSEWRWLGEEFRNLFPRST